MKEALTSQPFYAEGEAAYQRALRSNAVYSGADVRAYLLARMDANQSGNRASIVQARPQTQPLDSARPIASVHGAPTLPAQM